MELCEYCIALSDTGKKKLTRARSAYWILRLKTCTCDKIITFTKREETQQAGDQQIQEFASQITTQVNMNMTGNLTAEGAGAEGGDVRRLSVPPSLEANQQAHDLVAAVDKLLDELTVGFSAVCKEVFDKLDDMAARIDAMEARALASQGTEEAEGAAAAPNASK